jgi:hypothetical protein
LMGVKLLFTVGLLLSLITCEYILNDTRMQAESVI